MQRSSHVNLLPEDQEIDQLGEHHQKKKKGDEKEGIPQRESLGFVYREGGKGTNTFYTVNPIPMLGIGREASLRRDRRKEKYR